MATQSSWLGARVVSSDNLYKGTVRFEGELGDGKLAGLWLGVEWSVNGDNIRCLDLPRAMRIG